MNPCIFKWKFNCDGRNYDLRKAGAARIATVIKFSKEYKDDMHVDQEEALVGNSELSIDCHRSCMSTYTSKLHLSRQKKCQSSADDLGTPSQPSKKHCQSQVPIFKFRQRTACFAESCVNWRKTRSTPVDGKEQHCAVQRTQGLAKRHSNSPP